MGYYYKDDEDEYENNRGGSGRVAGAVAVVSGAILAILLIVLATNNTNGGRNNFSNSQMLAKESPSSAQTAIDIAKNYTDANGNKDIEKLYKDDLLRAEDLDFWNMYDKDGSQLVVSDRPSEEPEPSADADTILEDREILESEDATPSVDSPSDGPKLNEKGLIDGVKENTLDFTNVKIVNDKLHYSINDNEISKMGVDISAASGIVDFRVLKDNGIDFVMLKAGSRGYDSGLLSEDANFEQNIKAATEAGLEVGAYFSSRAITETEAVSEADFCVTIISDYNLKYPIAFCFEGEQFDTSRTDYMNNDERTKVVLAFLEQIENRGYTPIIFASEDYILNEINPEQVLLDYDVLLKDSKSIPTYPYQFKMWEYKNNIPISGVEKTASYVVSFIDYAFR